MNRQRFERATAFLNTRHPAIFGRERGYKLPSTDKLRGLLNEFLRSDLSGRLNVNQGNALDVLSWRSFNLLNRMAAAPPDTLREALQALWQQPLDPMNADAFWAALDPALDTLPPDKAKQFNGLGTRASVASYFLFIADPARFPFYRPGFGGEAIKYLYQDTPLERRSPGALLKDYGERCLALKAAFNEAGLPVADIVDVQSALYVLVQEHIKPA